MQKTKDRLFAYLDATTPDSLKTLYIVAWRYIISPSVQPARASKSATREGATHQHRGTYATAEKRRATQRHQWVGRKDCPDLVPFSITILTDILIGERSLTHGLYNIDAHFFSKWAINIARELGVHAGRGLAIAGRLNTMVDHELYL